MLRTLLVPALSIGAAQAQSYPKAEAPRIASAMKAAGVEPE